MTAGQSLTRIALTRFGLALTVALCGTLAVTAAQAEAKKQSAPQLVYRGCSHFVAPLCMGITSRGKVYALIGALPFIPPGTGRSPHPDASQSAPVNTARTPGAASALTVSMARMRAWAWGDRST